MRILTIIPARGGSKRIPRKNIKLFLGFPIIRYPIETALKSNLFSEVMVSTEDKEIAEVVTALGAKVPFLRSVDRAGDFTTTAEVLREVLDEYAKLGKHFDAVCCIYPTAVFIDEDTLKRAVEKLNDDNVDAVVSVTPFSHPIERALEKKDSYISFRFPENVNKRTQDFTPSYHDAGQFYLVKKGVFDKEMKLVVERTAPIEISSVKVQDIDNEQDWKLAEIKYSLIKYK